MLSNSRFCRCPTKINYNNKCKNNQKKEEEKDRQENIEPQMGGAKGIKIPSNFSKIVGQFF
jgi:hypothetical protein